MIKRIFILLFMSVSAGSWAQTEIPMLMTSMWHQKDPFNAQCPLVKNAAPAAGCGAIAVAQMLYYYKQPAHGFGRPQYTTSNYSVDIDLTSRTFEYDKIYNKYYDFTSTVAKDAVASLVAGVGAAMKMQYGTSSSPSNFPSMMWGLQHYLHFSHQCRYRSRRYYSTAEWLEMLNGELEQNRPVFYRGVHTSPGSTAAHLYVLDGRDKDGKYHANFGHASSTQDKYVDLNVINQGTDEYPGVYSVCYHHQQAMITDGYPVDGLTDADYDQSAFILTSPLVLGGQSRATTVTAKGSVQAQFRAHYANYVGGSAQLTLGFYQDGQLRGTSTTIRNVTVSGGGFYLNFNQTFGLPTNLPAGQYEMSIISRENAASSWVRGWDNAPNRVPVQVKSDGNYVFTMPNYHDKECNLFLEKSITEPTGGKTGGNTFELAVRNPTDNNFEDTIRLVVTSSRGTKQYDVPTSVYDGQKVTYRFFVSNSDADFTQAYEVTALYKETAAGKWLPLTENTDGVRAASLSATSAVRIFTVDGLLIRSFDYSHGLNDYSAFLGSLPKGVYLVSDSSGTRKFVKRT